MVVYPVKTRVRCLDCGMIRSASVHLDGHEWNPPPKPGFNQKPRTPIRPRSEERQRYYTDVRIPAVIEAVGDGYRPCEMRTPVCTGRAQTLHEPATRGRFGGLPAAVEAGGEIPSCDACNEWVGRFPIRAREMGLLRSNTVDGTRAPHRMPPRRGQ